MNRNHQFLSSRRDGDATHRRALAAIAAALLMLAPAAGAQTTSDPASPQGEQQERQRAEQQDQQKQKEEQQKEAHSNDLERKARVAHNEGDTGPVENWFGCPPKRDPNATRAPKSEVRAGLTGETVSGDDPCDPNAPANDGPQKKKSNY